MLLNNNMMGEASGLIPTDDTKTYSLLSTFDENRYYLNSTLHQNPVNKNVVLNVFTDGTAHVTDANKKIVFKKSTDKAATFGSKTTLYDPTDGTMQVQDPGIGYDKGGRLHIMADCHANFASSGQTHELRYMYSDDDGTTVSSPVTITLPSNGLATFRMYGKIIDMGGVLLAPAYFQTEEGNTTNSARYALRSTDRGANWSWVAIESTSAYINEMEFLAINADVVIGVARHEPLAQFWMYKSTDRGATWTSVGLLSTTIPVTSAAPCRLHKFQLDDGTWVAAMYFVNRGTGTKTLYGMYGRLDVGVDAGVGLFKATTTVTTLATNSNMIHYGDVVHYNGNMNARGAYTREITFGSDTELIYFETPATHYTTIYNLVKPITIYDNLALPELIMSYRGLVTNTTNAYGVVDGSGNITTLKSIAPGPTGRDFTATAGGITLNNGIAFDGTKVLTSGSAATTWNFLSYSTAGYTDVNYTVYFTIKSGTSSNPDAALGWMGTSAASSANKGVSIFYDDRSSVPRSNALVLTIAKGTVGFIIDFVNQNLITPNTDHVICIEVDLSQATNNNKVKVWVDDVLQSTTVTTFNTTVATPPTNTLQIGGVGNNTFPFIGTIKDVIIQNAIDLPGVRDQLIHSLMALEGL